jgi:hypothetical protein
MGFSAQAVPFRLFLPNLRQCKISRAWDRLTDRNTLHTRKPCPGEVYPYWTSGPEPKTCQYRVDHIIF